MSRRAAALHAQGLMLLDAGRPDAAAEAFAEAAALLPAGSPQAAAPLANLGLARLRAGDPAAAETALRDALASDPGNPDSLNTLGAVLLAAGRPDEAVRSFAAALAARPGSAEVGANLAAALLDDARPAEALAAAEAALAANPGDPGAAMNRAVALLTLGDYPAGFAAYAARWHTPDFRRKYAPPAAPAWDGAPLAGRTLLVRGEQGLGDQVMLARLLPLVAARKAGGRLLPQAGGRLLPQAGGRLLVEAHRPLLPLLAAQSGVDAWLPLGEPVPPHDLQAGWFDLPGCLGLTADSVPSPLLPAPTDSPPPLPAGEGPLIGLCWAGRPTPRDRSIPAADLVAAVRAGLEGRPARLVALHGSESEHATADALGIAAPRLPDLAATAAVCRACALVVSIDTATAHVAGAMAAPLVVLLVHGADWRWGVAGDASPWYPEARLLRQERPGDWSAALAGLRRFLATWSGE